METIPIKEPRSIRYIFTRLNIESNLVNFHKTFQINNAHQRQNIVVFTVVVFYPKILAHI